MHSQSTASKSSLLSTALWILQVLLALLFLFAGGIKLVLPLDVLAEQVPLPGLLVRAIGVIEVLAAIGLVLPGLLRIRPSMTAVTAAAVALEMVVATVFSLVIFGLAAAILPLAAGLLSAFVAYARWQLAPHQQRRSSARSVLEPAR